MSFKNRNSVNFSKNVYFLEAFAMANKAAYLCKKCLSFVSVWYFFKWTLVRDEWKNLAFLSIQVRNVFSYCYCLCFECLSQIMYFILIQIQMQRQIHRKTIKKDIGRNRIKALHVQKISIYIYELNDKCFYHNR